MEQGEFLFDVTDIVAHIFFAVGTTDEVRVTSPVGGFSGTFVYPEGEGVYLRFGEDSAPELHVGMSLFVEYEGPGDSYRFHTEVVSAEPRQVQIRLPHAVECSDRRLTKRVTVPSDAGFRFVADGGGSERTFAVQDLSDGGVGFVNASNTRLQLGEVLHGALHLPGLPPLRVGLELRHIQVRGGERVVGSRLVAISLADRGLLARLLVSLAA